MADEYDYGKETKTIVFEDNDHRHAKFFIKLRYDGFRQSEFFRQIISSYIDGDELFMEYLDSIKPQAKAKVKKSKKLRRVIENNRERIEQGAGKRRRRSDRRPPSGGGGRISCCTR